MAILNTKDQKKIKAVQCTLTSDYGDLLLAKAESQGISKSGFSRFVIKKYTDNIFSGNKNVWIPREELADQRVRHDFKVETFLTEDLYERLSELSSQNDINIGRYGRLIIMGYLYDNYEEGIR